jgi:DNA-binding PadR family transcriptional regulator
VLKLQQSFEQCEKGQNAAREKFMEETTTAFRNRYMKEFLDVLLLFNIEENGETSGYDFLKHLHRTYDLMLSPGTVYAVAYSMQRDNLIEAKGNKRKTVFSLTPRGRLVIETIRKSKKMLQFSFSDLIEIKAHKIKMVPGDHPETPTAIDSAEKSTQIKVHLKEESN